MPSTERTPSTPTRHEFSVNRAETVLARLGEPGVPAGHMTAEGFGGFQPLVDPNSPEGQASNRRVEIKVL